MENQCTMLPDAPSAPQRRYPRYHAPLPVSVIVREDAAETKTLQNISLTGLYFTSQRAYAEGSHLEVEIVLAGREYRIRVLVQRCTALPEGEGSTHGVAVLFVRGAEIHPFLASLATFLNKSA